MRAARPASERRKWTRLPLAIPVFVRSRDERGMEFLEFATALNVSAGGMLIAIRRVPPLSIQIKLEIPSAPLAAPSVLARVSRKMSAKALRSTPAGGFYLLGLKFSRPLLNEVSVVRSRRRKLASAV
jgi:PilZ domain-containing protein